MGNSVKVLKPGEEQVRRIAMDIGKQVVAYIDHAYPEAYDGIMSPKSFRLSVRNATANAIMAAVEAADLGLSDTRIKDHEEHRRTMRRLKRASGSYRE